MLWEFSWVLLIVGCLLLVGSALWSGEVKCGGSYNVGLILCMCSTGVVHGIDYTANKEFRFLLIYPHIEHAFLLGCSLY